MAPCADAWIDDYRALPDKEMFEAVAARIDREIHARYRLYPGNYIAADLLEQSNRFAAQYDTNDVRVFEQYLDSRLALIDLPEKDEPYLRQCLLTMYANPLYNYLKAHEQ